LLLARLLLAVLLLPAAAMAQRDSSRESLLRAEEVLELRVQSRGLDLAALLPAIVVSVTPAFEETRGWYPTAAWGTLARVLGTSGLRACEACMAPRLRAADGRLEHSTGMPDAAEIIRLDEERRGTSPPARTAIWLDETPSGVSLRVLDLRTSQILLAENFDPRLSESTRTEANSTLAREVERRNRGESLTHTFVDVTMYPGQHFSVDWVDQWGDTNANLSGFTLSLYDPVVGVGASYYRVVPGTLKLLVGAKVLMSVPTALVTSVTGESTELIDPLLTGVLLARVPIGRSNYGVLVSASTNGQFGVGISLMNFSLFPVLP